MNRIEIGDCRTIMREWIDQGVQAQTCVTSPPYYAQRNYGGTAGQLGTEATVAEYVGNLVDVFGLVRELLREDGTLWLNLGDTYAGEHTTVTTIPSARRDRAEMPRSTRKQAGLKNKDLIGIPWEVAFALRADGWYLRQDVIWAKKNCMPESVTDRCTKAHEYLFLLAKSPEYLYDHEAIKEPSAYAGQTRLIGGDGRTAADMGREKFTGNMGSGKRVPIAEMANKRSVWSVAVSRYGGGKHFAMYPEALIEPCVMACSRPGDIVLDPFMGSGTTARVAERLGRQYLGCELNPDYADLQRERTGQAAFQM